MVVHSAIQRKMEGQTNQDLCKENILLLRTKQWEFRWGLQMSSNYFWWSIVIYWNYFLTRYHMGMVVLDRPLEYNIFAWKGSNEGKIQMTLGGIQQLHGPNFTQFWPFVTWPTIDLWPIMVIYLTWPEIHIFWDFAAFNPVPTATGGGQEIYVLSWW